MTVSVSLKGSDHAWVSVPREPTREMIQAMENRMVEGSKFLDSRSIVYQLWIEVYRAMLRAAPKP